MGIDVRTRHMTAQRIVTVATTRAIHWRPEHRLWVAVLTDAVALLNRQVAGTQHECWGAQAWIGSMQTGPGSFQWVCAMLELDAAAVRRAIQQPERPAIRHARRRAA